MKNKKFKSNSFNKNFFRVLTVLFITVAMIISIFFSASSVNDNIKFGKDIKGSFVATVGVFDNSDSSGNSAIGLPNGDAEAAAEILNNKIDPMGNQQVNVIATDKHYLRVSAPKSSFDNNESRFRTTIQRSGGIFIFDSSWKDLLFSDDNKRTKMSDVFSGASATTIGQGTRNAPFIRFDLPSAGGKFSEIVDSLNPENGDPTPLTIMTDVDSFLDDFRTYYAINNSSDESLDIWFNKILKPLREKYRNSQDDLFKKVLFDLFFGEYTYSDNNETSIRRESLISEASAFQTADQFKKVMGSWKFLSDTNKYIYDPNSTEEDFDGTNGKYKTPVRGWTSNTVFGDIGKIKDVFSILSNNIFNTALSVDQDRFSEYFLYSGNVSKSEPATKSGGFIGDSGKAFFAQTSTFSQAKQAEATFKAASKGFSFFVFSVSENQGTISWILFLISSAALILIAVLIAIFLLIFYRLLGLFLIIVISTTIAIMMVSANVFNLTFGVETLGAIFIVVGLILDMNITLFEAMKKSMFLKKRSFKSSFIISHRDTIGGVVDAAVVLIIPNIILFWNSSNVIKSFATLVTIGGFITIILSIFVIRVMIYYLAKTEYLDLHPNWFAINTTMSKKTTFMIEMKYNSLDAKIKAASIKEPLGIKISKLREKLAFYQENSNDKLVKKYQDAIDKLVKKQDKILSKDEILLSKYNEKLAQLKIKREKALQKRLEKEQKYENVLVEKFKKKIDKYEIKKNKYLALENNPKVFKIDAAIEETRYLIDNNFSIDDSLVRESDNEENLVIPNEPETPKTAAEKIRVKRRERGIFKFSKLFLIFIALLASLATVLGLSVGPNYDSSFGKGSEFYIWGDYVESTYSKVEELSSGTWWIDDEPVPTELQDFAKDLLVSPSVNENEKLYQKTKSATEMLEFVISRDKYFKILTSSNLSAPSIKTNFGVNYTKFEQTGDKADQAPWIMLTFKTTNKKVLKSINNILIQFTDKTAGSSNDPERGVQRLILSPFSTVKLIQELAISLLIIIAGLIIYIIIRFKWTYYVAITLALTLGLATFASAMVVLQIPLGFSIIISASILISFILTNAIMILNHGKVLIQSKNEKSLTNYFNKEIDISVNNRENAAIYRADVRKLKLELKLKLQSKEISKEDKKNIKKEFKAAKNAEMVKLKELKKENSVKLSRAAKDNNYLKEVIVDVMNFAIKRLLLIGIFYVAIAITMILTMPNIFAFGLSMLLGIVISMFVTMFIIIPIWIFLEQWRLRNRLAFKRYINSLKVSQEEQIIEGIND
ncbi:protein translocase SecDF, variant type [Spiroplasma alleghenense]|uniref:Bifunctional preprotein translocase subunit SecD/SecF n=1 Tax=Spiroplasma alleghenense TaxID=216931 RepID=A0A345Z3E3_9MOLU|nr:protein translocase SecDF, variant type [Spiroplasma alleghenense]AXK51122.1 bifunctional preprotein translocase subunit SecD/SecF [Spiroplasma alleghenense]